MTAALRPGWGFERSQDQDLADGRGQAGEPGEPEQSGEPGGPGLRAAPGPGLDADPAAVPGHLPRHLPGHPPAEPRVGRPRRVGQGRLRPPTRRPRPGAPRVVAGRCAPSRRPIPVAALVGIAAFVTAVVYGLGLFAGSVAGADVPAGTTVVRVAPGETLTDLAARHAPGYDATAVVAKIRELNALSGSALRPGQPLTVPASR